MNTRLTVKNRVGLILCALLGVADLISLAAIGSPEKGQTGPPAAVLIASAVLGVITLVAVVPAWRSASRPAARVVAGSRVLSAITSTPAVFLKDVDAGLQIIAGGTIVLTLVGVWLLLSQPAPVPAATQDRSLVS
jgi:hypothetical protein